MDFRQLAREIKNTLSDEGYEVALDKNHKHPRVIVRCPGTADKAMILLSTTQNYDFANWRALKWQDIRRALKTIPKPVPENKDMDYGKAVANGVRLMNPDHPSLKQEPRPAPVTQEVNMTGPNAQDEQVSYPISIFLKGSTLGISIPANAVAKFPDHAKCARLMLKADRKLVIHFSTAGVEPGKTPGTGSGTAFYFKSGSVTGFNWPDRLKERLGKIFVRKLGDSLVTVNPLPDALFDAPTPAPAYNPSANKEGLDDLKAAMKLFNEALKGAYDHGLEPEVKFDGKHTIKLLVAEKRKVEL